VIQSLRGEGSKEAIFQNMFARKEIASSLVLILFGVVFLLYNVKYPLDTWANPGPGIFPLMVGAVLVVLAAWQLIQDVRKSKQEEAKERNKGTGRSIRKLLQRDSGEVKPLLMISVFIVYLLMVKWVGFFISNFLFVIISSKIIGARDWGRPIALSGGISLFCYFLFEVWLKLSFPRGFLF
jgi:putative tricarboxylic transport membrane protein